MKTWLKGGVIGVGIFLIIFSFFYIITAEKEYKTAIFIYEPFIECKNCESLGNTAYECALIVADYFHDTHFFSFNRANQEEWINNSIKSLINSCNNNSIDELKSNYYTSLPCRISSCREIDIISRDCENYIEECCENPEIAARAYGEYVTIQQICQYDSNEIEYFNFNERKPSKFNIYLSNITFKRTIDNLGIIGMFGIFGIILYYFIWALPILGIVIGLIVGKIKEHKK